jgi:hypothetical protein
MSLLLAGTLSNGMPIACGFPCNRWAGSDHPGRRTATTTHYSRRNSKWAKRTSLVQMNHPARGCASVNFEP